MAAPPHFVELTCSREPCHVVLRIPHSQVRLFLGNTCPECEKGVLVLRDEQAAPQRSSE
jgi:hypothetical protein